MSEFVVARQPGQSVSRVGSNEQLKHTDYVLTYSTQNSVNPTVRQSRIFYFYQLGLLMLALLRALVGCLYLWEECI